VFVLWFYVLECILGFGIASCQSVDIKAYRVFMERRVTRNLKIHKHSNSVLI